MKYIYTLLLTVLAVLMIIAGVVEKKKNKNTLGKSIQFLMTTCALTLAAYTAAILMPSAGSSRFFYGLYYILFDCMMIFMLIYSIQHANLAVLRKNMPVQVAIMAAAIIDSACFVVNFFTQIVFDCVQVTDYFGNTLFKPQDFGPLFVIHVVYVSVMVLSCVAALIYRAAATPRIYRFRALAVIASMLSVVAVKVFAISFNASVDLSLLFYGLLAFVIFYYSILYVPKSLIDRFLTHVAKNMEGSLVCFDIDGRCIFANETAFKLFRAENNIEKINEGFRQWRESCPEQVKDETDWKEHRVIDGVEKYFSGQYKMLKEEKSGRDIGSFFLLYDETEERKKIQEDHYRAEHDELTGLYNKKHFFSKVEERLKTAGSGDYCMVSTDVRDFKIINDMFGVEKGDMILIEIARTIERLAEEGTVYGRITGDRFAICMPWERYTEDLFLGEIERISHMLGSSFYQIRMHLGVYRIFNTSINASVILDRANMALRSIKYSYTDVIAYYDEKMRAARISEQKITAEFDSALESGQFHMFLQPQISVDGKTLGGEALVRWMHPERGLIPPAEFVGVFERTGLITRMDTYVWELACKKLRQWKDEGRVQFHISVNISPKDFFFTDVYKTFTDLVQKYEIDPKNLRLEITETAIMNDFTKQLSLIERLRGYGFFVEMDDFGSGYSSLNMLKDINVDTLKIDMGFLRKTANNERSAAIIYTIIALSKQLGMEVVTEGVETREQVDFLTNAGCDIFQGYYFAKPMQVSDFEEKYF